ncbi:hypothetical protein [Pedomonas mirosovicensis]|nr:hypothetical protein [Pedomonas mirosovicensis]MCH8685043.1 hypothetical protein [Pedomonas mirosovicensis]
MAAARFAVALAPLLLAVAVLSACRQDPTPQPLPDPITDKPNQSVAASAF